LVDVIFFVWLEFRGVGFGKLNLAGGSTRQILGEQQTTIMVTLVVGHQKSILGSFPWKSKWREAMAKVGLGFSWACNYFVNSLEAIAICR